GFFLQTHDFRLARQQRFSQDRCNQQGCLCDQRSVTSSAAQSVGRDFDELVREHQAMVFSIAYHFLHDRAMAEEVAQEVFLTLHRPHDELQSAAPTEFWLRKVAARRSIDEARRRKRRPSVPLADIAEPAADAPSHDPMLGEILRRLLTTLAD